MSDNSEDLDPQRVAYTVDDVMAEVLDPGGWAKSVTIVYTDFCEMPYQALRAEDWTREYELVDSDDAIEWVRMASAALEGVTGSSIIEASMTAVSHAQFKADVMSFVRAVRRAGGKVDSKVFQEVIASMIKDPLIETLTPKEQQPSGGQHGTSQQFAPNRLRPTAGPSTN